MSGGKKSNVFLELLRAPGATLAAIYLLALVAVAIFAPLIAPFDPAAPALRFRLDPPVWLEGGSWDHILGTDNLGRDVLSRILYGARSTLIVALSVVAIAGSFGVLMGLIAGYVGGRIDSLIMRIVDIQLSFPDLLLALTVLTVIGASLPTVIIILSIGGWMVYARMTRGIVIAARHEGYVEAAELIGVPPRRVILRHILPNLTASLLTLAIIELARVVLAEAALSFLGMGIQPPATSWGLDISVGKDHVFGAWWLVTFPGLAIALTILSANVLATWVRLTIDPLEREKRFALSQPVPKRRAPQSRLKEGVEPLLAIDDLHVSFITTRGRVDAVRGVSLSVRRGETLGIVGESGSGKSVTMQAVMGLIDNPGRIEQGDVRFEGKSLLDRGGERIHGNRISMVFQDAMTSLNPLMSIGTQITEVLDRHRGLKGIPALLRAHELLRLVGIPSPDRQMHALPHELSGGMRQRVMIAIALAAEPDVLIADEPTTALDVTIQAQIVRLLAHLRDRLGLTIVLVTHDLGLVAQFCDRVAVMYAGRIVETADVGDLFAAPAHPYTAGLLRSTPRLDRPEDRLSSIAGSPPDPADLPIGCAFRPRCERATDRCLETPPLTSTAPARKSACWYPLTIRGGVDARAELA